MPAPIESYLQSLHAELARLDHGQLANYIPELTKARPEWLGIAIVTMDGVVYSVGDAEQPFTIQSVSKPFMYGAALADRGVPLVSRKVGVEPSGDAFNSISLHPKTGAPMNPMINAGAIAVTSLVSGETAAEQWGRMHQCLSDFAGRELGVDESVYRSESETGHRNRAIAWMLKNFEVIDGDPMAALENYFRQCAVLVTCRDLAYMAGTLANGGVHPLTGRRALPAEDVSRVLSLMASCGMYDYSGSWLNEVGMPAKSGVGGGVIAVLPGRFGIAVFSPLLDEKGNSVRGIAACKRLSHDFGLHQFQQSRDPRQVLVRVYSGAEAGSRRKPVGPARELLQLQAHRIKYLALHGVLAVDGAEYVIRRMQSMADEAHSFILDMHQVTGLTDSAAQMLHQARRGFAQDGIAVVCSRLNRRTTLVRTLAKAAKGLDRGFLIFEDNDIAVEWCENRLLDGMATGDDLTVGLSESPLLQGLPTEMFAALEAVMPRREFPAGGVILRAGEPSDGQVFFMESGRVSVLVPLVGGTHQRVALLGPGTEFGEMTLLGQPQRTATVQADTEVVCRVLQLADLDRLAQQWPQLKIVLLENLARDLAVKLRGATQWIAALA